MYRLNLEKIRSTMESQDVNKTKLSEMTGISYSWIRRILNGESKNPRINTVLSIVAALGMDLEDIVVEV